MKKYLVLAGVAIGLLTSGVSADPLKNSLTNVLNKKDDTPMVDLSNLSVNGKRPVQGVPHKSRASTAVVATVNGKKVIKKDADAYLKKRTQGQVKDFDLLPKKQKIRLLEEMSLSRLAYDVANKELSPKEKEMLTTQIWMQKQGKTHQVSDAEVQKEYDTLKQKAIEHNATDQVPPFDKIKNNMKMQMTQKKIVADLMKDVEIKVIDANMIAGSIGDIYVSIEEADNAVKSVSKGKAGWAQIPKNDKMKLLKMIAPSKIIAQRAKKALSAKEKEVAFGNFWMQNRMSHIKVTEKQTKEAYAKLKKAAKKAKSKQKIPEYSKLEKTLEMQIAKEKVIAEVMKSAKIRLK